MLLTRELYTSQQISLCNYNSQFCTSCRNCRRLSYYDTMKCCDSCLGLYMRDVDDEDYICTYITPIFTISGVTFNIVDCADKQVISISSRYITMQFNTYHTGCISVQVTGDLAYILTGHEFTIICLLYGKVLRQWHNYLHKKEYPGDMANFRDQPLKFIVEPNDQIKILGRYRTYLITY